MNEYRVTFYRHNSKVRLYVWVKANSNKEAVEKAMSDKEVLFFFAESDALYDISVINERSIELSKLRIIKQSQLN